jgi:hypothetical protein
MQKLNALLGSEASFLPVITVGLHLGEVLLCELDAFVINPFVRIVLVYVFTHQ